MALIVSIVPLRPIEASTKYAMQIIRGAPGCSERLFQGQFAVFGYLSTHDPRRNSTPICASLHHETRVKS